MFRLVEMSGTCRSDSGAGVNKIGISESESQDEMKPKERKEKAEQPMVNYMARLALSGFVCVMSTTSLRYSAPATLPSTPTMRDNAVYLYAHALSDLQMVPFKLNLLRQFSGVQDIS